MFEPENPLKPRDKVFNEAWHAQTLALADTMIKAGHFSASQWASTLGVALKAAETDGKPDNAETYYHCAINALEELVNNNTPIDQELLKNRKQAWETAYLQTPHGEPVKLRP